MDLAFGGGVLSVSRGNLWSRNLAHTMANKCSLAECNLYFLFYAALNDSIICQ